MSRGGGFSRRLETGKKVPLKLCLMRYGGVRQELLIKAIARTSCMHLDERLLLAGLSAGIGRRGCASSGLGQVPGVCVPLEAMCKNVGSELANVTDTE